MVVVKMGNEFFDIDKNVFKNILEMYEIILPFEWHSVCMTIDLTKNTMKLYHNDHLQVVQNFTVAHQDQEGLSRLMTRGHLGGQRFVGYIADFQVFGSALPEDKILQWTTCNSKVCEIKCNIFARLCLSVFPLGIIPNRLKMYIGRKILMSRGRII